MTEDVANLSKRLDAAAKAHREMAETIQRLAKRVEVLEQRLSDRSVRMPKPAERKLVF